MIRSWEHGEREDIKRSVELSPTSVDTFSTLNEMRILWAFTIFVVQVQKKMKGLVINSFFFQFTNGYVDIPEGLSEI